MKDLNWKVLTKFNRLIIRRSFYVFLIFVLVWQCFPRITSYAKTAEQEIKYVIEVYKEQKQTKAALEALGEPKSIVSIPVTAYSSTVDQTDSTPCITANGFNLCENDKQNVIATNYLPFGTKVRFPDYDPDTIYTVEDRMNARYSFRADIWMKTRNEAKVFGIQTIKMEIY
ncbi:hypothetical protein ACFL2U_01230 [Patescibacteria group bacterium]